uniref:VWA domain-containing protein n=1 Tax=Thermorudis peleae TaxID=1382356 RepID=A0A831TCB6_9BACT
MSFDRTAVFRALQSQVVGRRQEAEEIVAALAAGRDVVLEGPPGTSKSTLLRTIAQASGLPFVLVEGNADLTPAKLIGYHNPAQVVRHGYRPEDFVPGPLPDAMQRGGFLYIEEFNRIPEDTLNVLLGPLAERILVVPRVGIVQAADTFRLIAAMNPFDNVGTMRVSRSIGDRLTRLAIGYQSEQEERAIVRRRTGSRNRWLVDAAVALSRATREHPEVRMGASVRGAIDLVLVAERLAPLRGVDLSKPDDAAKDVVLEAALLALSGRIAFAEGAGRTPEGIVRELWENYFYFIPQAARGRQTLDLPSAVALPISQRRRRRRRGPVVMPLQRGGEVPTYPKPGEVIEPPRIYRPYEAALLLTDRAGGPMARSAADILRDHPVARRVLREDGEMDPDELQSLLQEDPQAGISLLGDLWPHAPDEQLREFTRRLALKIVIRLARQSPTPIPGRGQLRSVRYRFNSDDLDLDRTLEEIAGKAYPEYDDFWVRERVRTRRTWVLLLDVSGSMRGAKLMNAALAVASLARSIQDDHFAVVLFWRDAAVLKSATQDEPLPKLLDEILRVRARGLTNLRLGLEVGLRELERTVTREKIGIIFTDGIHNLGADPLPIAAKYPRLHVIGPSPGDARVRVCQELAARGRGRCIFVEEMEDIPAAISYCVSG